MWHILGFWALFYSQLAWFCVAVWLISSHRCGYPVLACTSEEEERRIASRVTWRGRKKEDEPLHLHRRHSRTGHRCLSPDLQVCCSRGNCPHGGELGYYLDRSGRSTIFQWCRLISAWIVIQENVQARRKSETESCLIAEKWICQ